MSDATIEYEQYLELERLQKAHLHAMRSSCCPAEREYFAARLQHELDQVQAVPSLPEATEKTSSLPEVHSELFEYIYSMPDDVE